MPAAAVTATYPHINAGRRVSHMGLLVFLDFKCPRKAYQGLGKK